MKNLIHCLMAFVITVFFPCVALAKNVNLYDQPLTTSKVVGTIDSSNELIPIITSKAGDWMKVGDPKDGNVGWIKVSDMGSNNGMGVAFTQRTVSTSSGPRTIQTIKFETPQTMTPDQSNKMLKEMQQRQLEMQQYTQRMMQHVSQEMNNFYKQNPSSFDMPPMPMIMPVIIMANPSNQTTSSPAPLHPTKMTTPTPLKK